MDLLEYLVVGLFYVPFLALPFLMIFWYAFASNRQSEQQDPPHKKEEEKS